MNFWGICLTVIILNVTQLEAAWDSSNVLILNRVENRYYLPKYVEKSNDGSYIQYIGAEDATTTMTYTFCGSKEKTKDNPLLDVIGGPYDKEKPIQQAPCNIPVEPGYKTITSSTTGKFKTCGTTEEKRGILQRAFYRVPLNENEKDKDEQQKLVDFILYEQCFDASVQEIIYVRYKIDNPRLLSNELLKDEQDYKFEIVSSETADLYKKNLYNLPRLVGIPEFIPFAHMRKSFYDDDFLAPLNEELLEIWNRFLLNVRGKIAKKTNAVEVYSGVYERKRIHGDSNYLYENNLPSPYAYWLLLYNHDSSQGISFILHNYAFDLAEKKHKKLCDESVCQRAGFEDSIPNPMEYEYALIYCCHASAITDLYSFKEANDLFTFKEV